MNKAWLMIAVTLTIACVGASHAQSGETSVAGGDLPPPGYGTLSQDDISIRFNAGDIDIRMVPLDQRVMRLLGPDVYASLNKLTMEREPSIDSVAALGGASDPGLMLVSFFGLRDGVRFEPLNVFLRNPQSDLPADRHGPLHCQHHQPAARHPAAGHRDHGLQHADSGL